jgi:zona occludens toxin (predicted ATPase)
MTAVIHHGPPGSYKTFALIQRVIIPALEAGRTVCHNIRGLDNLDRIAEVMGLQFPETARLICVKHDSEEGFKYMARFFQWAPVGALIVMDEGQRVYPTRLRNLSGFDTAESDRETLDNGIQRPWNVENAFDQHRHMNWDIYISTTNVDKVHKEVRQVVEYAFRHRDMSGILPWYKNKWREFKHDAESTGKQVSHYIGTPKLYSADFRVFDCYKSTATGTAKASSENKSIFADSKLRIFAGIFVLAFAWFVFNAVKVADRWITPPDAAIQALPSPSGLSTDPDTAGISVAPGDSLPAAVTARSPGASYPQTAVEFFKRYNSRFSDESVYQYPLSKGWRLTGVVVGHQSVAMLFNGSDTITLALDSSCINVVRISKWVCLFAGEVVGDFTGPKPEPDEYPISNVPDVINDNSLMPLNM